MNEGDTEATARRITKILQDNFLFLCVVRSMPSAKRKQQKNTPQT